MNRQIGTSIQNDRDRERHNMHRYKENPTHKDRYKHTERDICNDREIGTTYKKRQKRRKRERELNEIKFITDLSQFLLFRHFF